VFGLCFFVSVTCFLFNLFVVQAALSQQQAALESVRTKQEGDGLWTKLAGCVGHEQDLQFFFERRQRTQNSAGAGLYYIYNTDR